jgi:hypothetical protein
MITGIFSLIFIRQGHLFSFLFITKQNKLFIILIFELKLVEILKNKIFDKIDDYIHFKLQFNLYTIGLGKRFKCKCS